MMTTPATESRAMTLGEKLKAARKSAGLTQEQLASAILVSRQAITKWEADKGMPDVENLKRLSQTLGISLDALLDTHTALDMHVLRREIHLEHKGVIKKSNEKDQIIREAYPEAEVRRLTIEQLSTKAETIIDNVIGFFTTAPFGISEFLNALKHINTACYLVNQDGRQYLVTITDEYMESRQLVSPITAKRFEIGEFRFTDCGFLKNKQ